MPQKLSLSHTNALSRTRGVQAGTGSVHTSAREELLPLMFEMGRLLKSETYRDGVDMPSFLHIETLRFIKEAQTPSMSDIADYLKVARPSATALVNAFVKMGIIERAPDSEDRRIVRLQLSKKGKTMLEETMHKRAKAFARVIAPLSDADSEELVRILSIITRNPV